MKFKNFIDAVKDKLRRPGAAPVSRETRTLLHWKIIVILFLLAVAGIFFNSFLIYRDINQGEFSAAKGGSGASAPVTAADLNNIVNYFKTRNAAFEQIKNGRAVLVDPSR